MNTREFLEALRALRDKNFNSGIDTHTRPFKIMVGGALRDIVRVSFSGDRNAPIILEVANDQGNRDASVPHGGVAG